MHPSPPPPPPLHALIVNCCQIMACKHHLVASDANVLSPASTSVTSMAGWTSHRMQHSRLLLLERPTLLNTFFKYLFIIRKNSHYFLPRLLL